MDRYDIEDAIEEDDLILDEALDLSDAIGQLTKKAVDLDDLLEILQLQTALFKVVSPEWHHDLGVSFGRYIEDFPVFSDDEPGGDLQGIWSYDDDQVLVADGWGSWEIIQRDDNEELSDAARRTLKYFGIVVVRVGPSTVKLGTNEEGMIGQRFAIEDINAAALSRYELRDIDDWEQAYNEFWGSI